MVANSNSTAPRNLLSISQAAEQFGVSVQTLRNWDNAGKVTTYRVGNNGWRKFEAASIATHLGMEVEQGETGAKLDVIYSRVSSTQQKTDGNLDRQTGRMRTAVGEAVGVSPSSVPVYEDVASSYGDRKSLNQLVEDVISGKVGRIWCEYKDRLSRIPGLFALLESICRNRGVEIVIVNAVETDDSVREMMEEILAFSQICCNRISGRKGGAATKREITTEQLQLAYSLKKQGFSVASIVEQFAAKGEVCNREKLIQGRAGERMLQKLLGANWNLLEQKNGQTHKQTTFDEFCEKVVRVGGSAKSKTGFGRLVENYNRWCEKNGKRALAMSSISKAAASKGWAREQEGRKVYFVGMTLNSRT